MPEEVSRTFHKDIHFDISEINAGYSEYLAYFQVIKLPVTSFWLMMRILR